MTQPADLEASTWTSFFLGTEREASFFELALLCSTLLISALILIAFLSIWLKKTTTHHANRLPGEQIGPSRKQNADENNDNGDLIDRHQAADKEKPEKVASGQQIINSSPLESTHLSLGQNQQKYHDDNGGSCRVMKRRLECSSLGLDCERWSLRSIELPDSLLKSLRSDNEQDCLLPTSLEPSPNILLEEPKQQDREQSLPKKQLPFSPTTRTSGDNDGRNNGPVKCSIKALVTTKKNKLNTSNSTSSPSLTANARPQNPCGRDSVNDADGQPPWLDN